MADFTIIELNTIDSTNNYAMQLIDADKAQHGLTITAQTQLQGKGQRGNAWLDTPGKSLLMSVIVHPKHLLQAQFSFNAAVTSAIATVLQYLYKNTQLYIKWPNDIIVGDKKAGGILIENVIRGSQWTHSVIGIGLNVNQETMPDDLPFGTSLKIASGTDYDVKKLALLLRDSILGAIDQPASPGDAIGRYNEYLYKRGQAQKFKDDKGTWPAVINCVHTDGTIELIKGDGSKVCYAHGQVVWVWE